VSSDRRADAMRSEWRRGMRQADIAAKYGVAQSTVSKALSGNRSLRERAAEAERYRARCMLAQSIVNQRATTDGLSRDDAAAVAGALAGVWDH
jgi:predicted transcriptional regulator